jgi:hypothetical protein
LLFFTLFYFGSVFWLSLYMVNRDFPNRSFIFTGLGLLICAAGLGASLLMPYADDGSQKHALVIIQMVSSYLPLVFWAGAIIPSERELTRITPWANWRNILLVRKHVLAYVPILLYVCNALMLFLLSDDVWMAWGLFATSLGMVVFAVHLLIEKVREQGESWMPDFLRSLDYSAFFTLIFAGQVALVIHWGTGFTFPMLILLLISIMVSIAFQVFIYPIRALLDTIAFSTFPRLRQERFQLRLVESVQPRIDVEAKPEEMNDDELYRHIRRALSNLGNLERLATSPLTRLPLIEKRLMERGAADDVFERAIELKSLIMERILQLKPRVEEDFGTTEEWKFYNVLYFPYIVGIKPYSVRYTYEQLDPHSQDALEWFRTTVPERTCYNWQNAGARLIALGFKEKSAS